MRQLDVNFRRPIQMRIE